MNKFNVYLAHRIFKLTCAGTINEELDTNRTLDIVRDLCMHRDASVFLLSGYKNCMKAALTYYIKTEDYDYYILYWIATIAYEWRTKNENHN